MAQFLEKIPCLLYAHICCESPKGGSNRYSFPKVLFKEFFLGATYHNICLSADVQRVPSYHNITFDAHSKNCDYIEKIIFT